VASRVWAKSGVWAWLVVACLVWPLSAAARDDGGAREFNLSNAPRFGTPFQPRRVEAPAPYTPAPIHHSYAPSHSHVASEQSGSGGYRVFCVRLCDGFFYPMGTTGSDESTQDMLCRSGCPDAKTAVFRGNSGSDPGEAQNEAGERYADLPVAFKFRTSLTAECTCRRDPGRTEELTAYKDPTLKPGDAVVTNGGAMIFVGGRRPPFAPSDFASLRDSDAVSKSARSALLALLGQSHGTIMAQRGKPFVVGEENIVTISVADTRVKASAPVLKTENGVRVVLPMPGSPSTP
jgi:hypothetical protein